MNNIKKNIIYFLLISVILILLSAGIFVSFGLYPHCIAVHDQSMCQMQILASMLDVAVLPSNFLLVFVLLMVMAVLTVSHNLFKSLLNLTNYYLKQTFQLFGSFLLFNYLVLIFKQGILHPKIF